MELHELLLREANHRTANILQLAIAGLDRCARMAPGSESRDAIFAAVMHLQTLAYVHAFLNGVESFDAPDCRNHLERLCRTLHRVLLEPRGVVLRFASEPLELPAATWQALALVMNELIVNAAKHAFHDGRVGFLDVTVGQRDGRVTCIVRDECRGRRQGGAGKPGSGTALVDGIARRHGGGCTWRFGAGGTEARAEFAVDGGFPGGGSPCTPAGP